MTLAETEYAPGMHVTAHAHEHPLLCLVLDGAFIERTGRHATSCESGSLIFHPRNEPHAHDFHAGLGARCFNVQFAHRWAERLAALGLHEPSIPIGTHRSKASWLATQLYDEFRVIDSASQLSIEGYVLALLGELARLPRMRADRASRPAWLSRAEEHLHAHFLEPRGLKDMAQLVGVDPTHLARTFRRHHGCTMSEYVRRLRVDLARHRLAETQDPLSNVALDTGFTDQAHFSRVFKALTGQTPGAYRRNAAR